MAGIAKWIAGLFGNLRTYHFEIRHLTVLVTVLIVFQLVVSFVHRRSIQEFLTDTQQWYQQDSAERLANLTATSLELLLESEIPRKRLSDAEERRIVQSFNIIFSQQLLHRDVQELCLLVERGDQVVAIDDGKALYATAFENRVESTMASSSHAAAIQMYRDLRSEIRATEQIHTTVERDHIFHTFVPFVPGGEFVGVVYMRNVPDFTFITRELIASYNETTGTFLALILFGLIAMFYVSSYTLAERNRAQHLLFEEQKIHLGEQIRYQNELLFTKRIYHTHHKAEKIMGFIKEDLRNLTPDTMGSVQDRVTRYSNFVARVIYDMKWYDPPLHTTRSPIFRTDVNEVIRFLVDNVFRRVVGESQGLRFQLELDDRLPVLPLNEFVLWEVLEPIIQNSIDHAGPDNAVVILRTSYDAGTGTGTISVGDAGTGIAPGLLEKGEDGIRKIFKEHVTTKMAVDQRHAGYGCYIAYELAKQRCGWDLDAENLPEGGCQFTFTFVA
jgi:signal transduction histidine kinase